MKISLLPWRGDPIVGTITLFFFLSLSWYHLSRSLSLSLGTLSLSLSLSLLVHHHITAALQFPRWRHVDPTKWTARMDHFHRLAQMGRGGYP